MWDFKEKSTKELINQIGQIELYIEWLEKNDKKELIPTQKEIKQAIYKEINNRY